MRTDRRDLAHYAGCLLGGAVGDALGAPVEFLSLAEIRRKFGQGGIRDFAPAYGRIGAITDDTQMTLFTAEGLIRGDNRAREKGIGGGTIHCVYHAYLRWYETQGGRPAYPVPATRGGWLFEIPALHSSRAPGNTCLSALASGKLGTMGAPLNSSKGCGGIMRVAPVGLAGGDAYQMGCEVAAITHGHPSGFLSAGFLAALIREIIAGAELPDAVAKARERLRAYSGHEECLNAVDAAVRLAEAKKPRPETLEFLGGGWTGEEALAIALYCALVADDFEGGVTLAVNHGGDSDSTGAITGNILGALWGVDAIPPRWRAALELRAQIEELAGDLYRHFGPDRGTLDPGDDWEKYPGY
jgi:ADP-ribosylglycohydrolase